MLFLLVLKAMIGVWPCVYSTYMKTWYTSYTPWRTPITCMYLHSCSAGNEMNGPCFDVEFKTPMVVMYLLGIEAKPESAIQ